MQRMKIKINHNGKTREATLDIPDGTIATIKAPQGWQQIPEIQTKENPKITKANTLHIFVDDGIITKYYLFLKK